MWDDGWSLLNSMYEAEIIPNLVTYTWLLYASISSNDHLKYRLGKVSSFTKYLLSGKYHTFFDIGLGLF